MTLREDILQYIGDERGQPIAVSVLCEELQRLHKVLPAAWSDAPPWEVEQIAAELVASGELLLVGKLVKLAPPKATEAKKESFALLDLF